jgi:hypothetical protein
MLFQTASTNHLPAPDIICIKQQRRRSLTKKHTSTIASSTKNQEVIYFAT